MLWVREYKSEVFNGIRVNENHDADYMMQICELSDEDKPREKLIERGANVLRLEELIAILLGSGMPGRDVMTLGREIGDVLLSKTFETKIDDLVWDGNRKGCDGVKTVRGVQGVGPAKACVILAALELARRFPPPAERYAVIKSSEDVVPFVSQYRFDTQENVIVASVSGANEIIKIHLITRGIVNQSQVHPREVFAPAIEDHAAAIILIHNHPSGNLSPSPQDILMTERIKQAGNLLGITLMDHLIIGPRETCRSII